MSKNLLIVFVKNILLGKVKTRLAKSIGDIGAFEVYKKLVEITETETSKLTNCDIHIYFSDVIIDSKWPGKKKFVQEGDDLGERMNAAFKNGFDEGYDGIIGIGSDLPDLNAAVMLQGFESLANSDTVFGPAEDGGYYLIGMTAMHDFIFRNKSWSKEILMDETKDDLRQHKVSYLLLDELNDVDTLDDLRKSSVSDNFTHFYELSRSNE